MDLLMDTLLYLIIGGSLVVGCVFYYHTWNFLYGRVMKIIQKNKDKMVI